MGHPSAASARPGAAPEVSARDVEATSRDTTVAQWTVASVVMAGSAVAGGFAFHHLGEFPALGVVTALAVDAALAAWLLISRRLRAVGVTSPMGHVLEVVTCCMTLFLNIGSAAFVGIAHESGAAKALLSVAHSFLPIVLVLISVAGAEAQLKLLRLRQVKEAEEKAAQVRQMNADRDVYETRQREIKEVKRREDDRLERIRQDSVRVKEQELKERQLERAQRDRQLTANIASILSIGAALRTRSARRPTRASQVRPTVSQRARPRSVPVTEELLSHARVLRAQYDAQGKTAGRTVFERELGVPERTAKALVRKLGQQRPPVGRRDSVDAEAAQLFAELDTLTTGTPHSNGNG